MENRVKMPPPPPLDQLNRDRALHATVPLQGLCSLNAALPKVAASSQAMASCPY